MNLSRIAHLIKVGTTMVLCVLDNAGEIWSLQFDDDLATSALVAVSSQAESMRIMLEKARSIFADLDIHAWKRNQKLVNFCTDAVEKIKRECAQKRKRYERDLSLNERRVSVVGADNFDYAELVKPEERKRQKQEEGLKKFYKKAAKLEQLRKQALLSGLKDNPLSVDEFAAVSKFSDISDLVAFFAATPIQRPPKMKARLELLDNDRKQMIKEREERIREWKQGRPTKLPPVQPHSMPVADMVAEVEKLKESLSVPAKSRLQVLRSVLEKAERPPQVSI